MHLNRSTWYIHTPTCIVYYSKMQSFEKLFSFVSDFEHRVPVPTCRVSELDFFLTFHRFTKSVKEGTREKGWKTPKKISVYVQYSNWKSWQIRRTHYEWGNIVTFYLQKQPRFFFTPAARLTRQNEYRLSKSRKLKFLLVIGLHIFFFLHAPLLISF